MTLTGGPAEAPLIRVMGLHALAYCERLFYLEEVEEIRVADERVYAGRTLHLELEEEGEIVDLTLESERLGVRGRLDAVRRRDGTLYPIEHKRGRAMRGMDNAAMVWPSDRLQLTAYALLLEEHTGHTVEEGRVRYHADNHTIRVRLGETERARFNAAVLRARLLSSSAERPPVTSEEKRCVRCSLAPVCLPEEARLAKALGDADLVAQEATPTPVRLFPPDLEARPLHVVTQGAVVGRSDKSFVVRERGATKLGVVPVREVSDVVLHGFAQITTQALRLAADEDVPVHIVTMSGSHIGTFTSPTTSPQRRIRQFKALTDDVFALSLARRLVMAKVELQLRFVLRGTRKDASLRSAAATHIATMRAALKGAAHASGDAALLGFEGNAARAYFACLALLVIDDVGLLMKPKGRTRRPPEDRFNALLSFAYALLHKDIDGSIRRVGLDPAFGFYHRARSAAFPLSLDLMELFRVPLVDMPILAAVNRKTFHVDDDFSIAGTRVWLSETGRRKLIEIVERRKGEELRHSVVNYSLSYARLMELEVRLLEKEWTGEPGLFARLRIR